MDLITPEVAVGITVFLGFIFSIVVHECAHGIAAYWCGDDTAYLLGRITLDPIPHVDPVMSVLLPGLLLLGTGGQLAFGGAKPVPVNATRLRHPLRDMMWVAVAGPLSNILLAVCFTLAINLVVFIPQEAMAANVVKILVTLTVINMLLVFFNLIPIPPLDGSRILAGLLPEGPRQALYSLEPYGLFIIMGLIFIVGLPVGIPASRAGEFLWNLLVFVG